MRVLLAADHAGIELKAHIVSLLEERGHEAVDLGPRTPESVDYADYAHRLARELLDGGGERGVLVCGSGIGMAMSANRHRGIRAVCTIDVHSARMARAHNDANVLCLGERIVGTGLAGALLEAFLDTPFDGGRHERRVAKIDGPS